MFTVARATMAYIPVIIEKVFKSFKKEYPVDSRYYTLDIDFLECAIQNAITNMAFSKIYRSDIGANIVRKAAYVGMAIATIRPIQVVDSYPRNLPNCVYLDFLVINCWFAVHVFKELIGDIKMCGQSLDQLLQDVMCHFETWSPIDKDAVNMFLGYACPLKGS